MGHRRAIHGALRLVPLSTIGFAEQEPSDTVPAVPNHAPVDRRIWLNGQFVPWHEATVHVLSHSLQRGSLVFDYTGVHQTVRGPGIFRLDVNVARLLHSCQLMGLPLAYGQAEIEAAIIETVRANPGSRAVKASAFYASVEVDVVPLDRRVSLAIAAYDPQADILAHLPGPPRARPRTVRLWLEKKTHQRREDIVSPQAKVSANYASGMMAKSLALKAGFDEVLFVNEDDQLAEGPTTNLFVVDATGRVRTPPEQRVLRGVTRLSVIELAHSDGIAVDEADIAPHELTTAREVFLTGTTAGVLPVESVDGRPVGETCPGPVATRLGDRLRLTLTGEAPGFEHWLTYVQPQ